MVLGNRMLGQNRVAEAVNQYEAALQVAPEYREAALHLEQARTRIR